MGDKDYTTHKYYAFCFRDIQCHRAFHWLWKSKSTMKIKVFGWLLLSDRLNTRNMLKRRHYNIGNNHDCILCGQHIEETLEHLFFGCSISNQCWATLGIAWHQGGTCLSKISMTKDTWRRPLFMEVFLLAAWSIWKERNNKHFRGIAPSLAAWLSRFKVDFSLLTYRVKEKHKNFIPLLLSSLQ